MKESTLNHEITTPDDIPPGLLALHKRFEEERKNDIVGRLGEFATGLATDFPHLGGEIYLKIGDRELKVTWVADAAEASAEAKQ